MRRILIFFGLTDRHAMVLRSLQALADLDGRVALDAVIGHAAPSFGKVASRRAVMCASTRLHTDIDVEEMARLAVAADLAVGAGGVAAFERCCIGLPSVTVITADNQLGTAALLRSSGAALVAGKAEDLDAADLGRYVLELAQSEAERLAMSRRAAAFCDGLGTRRAVDAIERLAA